MSSEWQWLMDSKVEFPEQIRKRYTNFEQIGQGGMGVVYSCYDEEMKREVALKLMRREVALLPKFVRRFSREARLLSKVKHPSVIELYDFDEVDGFFYYTMRFVDGASLDQVKFDQEREIETIVKYLRDMASALDCIHGLGLIHRDIKPANILVDEDRVLLSDFGFARFLDKEAETMITRTSEFVGTPMYMPRESLLDCVADVRTDIYQLGVTFFELLTSEMPHGAFNLAQLLKFHQDSCSCPPPSKFNPEIDSELDLIIGKCLASDPDLRWQRAEELTKNCDRWLSRDRSRGALPNETTLTPRVSLNDESVENTKSKWFLSLIILGSFIAILTAMYSWYGKRDLTYQFSVKSEAQRVSIHWTTPSNSLFRYKLFQQGLSEAVFQSAEQESQKTHDLVLNNLVPDIRYVLKLVTDQGESNCSFRTEKIMFRQNVPAIAHQGSLYLDYESNLSSQLQLIVRGRGGLEMSTKVSPTFAGVAIAELRVEPSYVYDWQICLRETVIAHGRVNAKMAPLASATSSWKRDGVTKYPWPVGNPLLRQDDYIFLDRASAINVIRPNESECGPNISAPLGRFFHLVPSQSHRPESMESHLGGVALHPNGKLVFISKARDKAARLWSLDLDERLRASSIPAQNTYLDNLKLLKNESMQIYEGLGMPGPNGFVKGDLYFSTIVRPRPNVACLSLSEKRKLWTSVKFPKLQRPSDHITACFPLNDHLFVIAHERKDENQMTRAVIGSLPISRQEPKGSQIRFNQYRDWWGASGFSIIGRDLWITGPDKMYCWRNAPLGQFFKVYEHPEWKKRKAYIGGSPIDNGGKKFFLHYDVDSKSSGLGLNVNLASWNPIESLKIYEPPLFEVSKLRMPSGLVLGMVLSERYLSGATSNAVFAIERKTGRFAHWKPTGMNFTPTSDDRDSLMSYTLVAKERAVVLDRKGNSYLMPVELLFTSKAQKLSPKPAI